MRGYSYYVRVAEREEDTTLDNRRYSEGDWGTKMLGYWKNCDDLSDVKEGNNNLGNKIWKMRRALGCWWMQQGGGVGGRVWRQETQN